MKALRISAASCAGSQNPERILNCLRFPTGISKSEHQPSEPDTGFESVPEPASGLEKALPTPCAGFLSRQCPA